MLVNKDKKKQQHWFQSHFYQPVLIAVFSIIISFACIESYLNEVLYGAMTDHRVLTLFIPFRYKWTLRDTQVQKNESMQQKKLFLMKIGNPNNLFIKYDFRVI